MHFHKAGAILLQDKKILVVRSHNSSIFLAPGGKIEVGETASQALERELMEELGILVTDSDLKQVATIHHPAAGVPNATTTMEVFRAMNWQGELQPHSEIEELAWVDSTSFVSLQIGSIFAEEIIPRLKSQKLIN